MFDRLRKTLGGGRTKGQQETDAGQSHQVSREDLLAALDAIQQEFSGSATFGHTYGEDEPLNQRLSRRLRCPSLPPCLQTPEWQCLEFATALFHFIAGYQNIPVQLRPLILMLHAPYAKLCLLDERFMSAAPHPAWNLLNNLAFILIGWTPEFENAENSLQRRLEVLVNQILLEFERDPEIFTEIDQEFAAYTEQQTALARTNEDRTLRASKGKEVLQAAQIRTTEEIDVRLENNPSLPKVVEVILKDGWRNVLLKTALRHGIDSDEWKKAVRMIDTLLWSVSPETSKHHKRELLHAIPQIINGLREGLGDISYDDDKTRRLLKKLQACHIACIRGQDVWMTTEGETTTVVLGGPAHQMSLQEGSSHQQGENPDFTLADNFFWIAKSLPLGSWVEIRKQDITERRVKLAWKSEIANICLFVDRHGDKAVEMGYADLATMLHDGKALVLSDTDQSLRTKAMKIILRHMEEELLKRRSLEED